ncbi:period circadian protein homolog 2-like [Trichomycterus rosablanca]|uniref:period circadian protein homolog 2-like n=1 Tax=Trichomycterus rosablanca TaxID=2290929 RepID=UPI002F3552AE
MSAESGLKSYLSGGGSEEEGEGSGVPMPHLHEMGGASDGSDSGNDPPASPGCRPPLHEDMEMGGNGSSGSDTESHGNEWHGNESVGGSSGNGKDSALLGSSGSNKSSNSQSSSPPSSSNTYSLLSSEQDHPSTSGCSSSEQSARTKTQKQLLKTLKKLKHHLPAEKRSKGRASTLHTLRYALRCVKQVKANEEYYQMLMVNDSQPPGLDVSSYTIDEINSIMSEYTLKNTDIFAVAVSLITGKIVYISEQAATILHCRMDEFTDRKFVEFLTPQDVSVFYSYTTPYRLPAWSMCTGTESSAADFVQEKSFFCRISGGKEKDGDLQYYPFRMTPYLMKVQDTELSEEHFCCLILAERVHSGYEAPRIPTDKRMFTTTHTPNCVFQDVDERAVPLLGYLPQDLIGTPFLLHIHPDDRSTMLAVHRKILQYVGQAFDHSSIRLCTRNGEYITLDTSWSSFVNPWSRKVSFVIGRHKVRMGPVNEDVFSVPTFTEGKIMDSDIQEITEQIHKILMQPVHSLGSSGYGSHGSNGSHDHMQSVTSSSDSNSNANVAAGNDNAANSERGKTKPRSFQEICKGVQMLKMQDQHLKSDPKKSAETGLKSPGVKQKDAAPVVRDGTAAVEELRDQTLNSYQQISCLDSVIRYLESCNTPITVKRKYQFSSNTTSSNSDEEKKGGDGAVAGAEDSMKTNKKSSPDVVGGALAESVVSIPSQCSYSSTIVHVGDKKPQPAESEIIEDVSESPTPPAAERGAYRKVGLTRRVLAAHTQKEEQAFLSRCKELCLASLQRSGTGGAERERRHAGDAAHAAKPGTSGAEPTTKRSGRTKKSKKPRIRKSESSDSAVSQRRPRPPLQGLDQTSWSPSEASRSAFSVPYPAMMPGYTIYPTTLPPAGNHGTSGGFGDSRSAQAPPTAPQLAAPMVTPVVAFVLPDYMFPEVGMAARPPFYPEQHQAYAPQQLFRPQHIQQNYNSQNPLQPQQAQFQTQPNSAPQQPHQQAYPPQHTYLTQNPFRPQTPYTPPQTCCLDDDAQSDALSTSSEPMELLMQEDSGSATSASTGSNGCDTSNSGTGECRPTKYFGSVDSSEHEEKREEAKQNFKYVLQDPLWLLVANGDDKVLMNYQVPPRDLDQVLRDDRERLRQMQKSQPRFTADQRRELVDQHPWMRRGGLPKAINIKDCMYCKDDAAPMLEDNLPDMALGLLGVEAAQEEGVSHTQEEEEQPGLGSVS